MTEQEKQKTKAMLIEMGIWGEDEPGDPLTNRDDALEVHSRLRKRLDSTVCLDPRGYAGPSPRRHIDVVRGEFVYELADGDNYQEAICLAALMLPEFLMEHPECAAKD